MKKLFILLITFIGIGFTSFGYCGIYDLVDYIGGTNNITIDRNSYATVIQLNDSSDYGTYCLEVSSLNGMLQVGFNSTLSYNVALGYDIYSDWGNFYACIYSNMKYIFLKNPNNQSVDITYKLFKLNALLNTEIPVYTSQQCQSEYNLVPSSDLSTCQSNLSSCQTSYSGCMNSFNSHNCQALFNLIPIESVDTNYCQINNLCPSSSTPCVGSGISNFYIFKDNRYIPISGTTNIFVNLPEYLDYSYEYSNGGEDLDIDLNYNVDTEYIDGIIKTQNYKPTSEDFTNLVGMLAPYSKYLIFLVFIFIIWAWIKKPFKSKKL